VFAEEIVTQVQLNQTVQFLHSCVFGGSEGRVREGGKRVGEEGKEGRREGR